MAIAAEDLPMVSLAEASRRTGIPYITLRRWVVTGELPGAVKDGREWAVPLPLPRELTEKSSRRRQSNTGEKPTAAAAPSHSRWIGVVDTGLIQQLEDARGEVRWLRQENNRLLSALIELATKA